MKKILLLLILFPIVTLAQSKEKSTLNLKDAIQIDKETNKVVFEEVVSVDSTISKTELYFRAREWFANTFKSANDVIQMDDKEAGKIIGKGTKQYTTSFVINIYQNILYYTVNISVKDGRYKYIISNFKTSQLPSYHGGVSMPGYQEMPIETIILGNDAFKKNGEYKASSRDHALAVVTTSSQIIGTLKEAMNKKASNTKSDNW